MSKNENLNYSLNDRIECYHNQVIYPSAYYPPPALSHVSTNVPNLGSTNCDIFQSFNKHPASAKIMKNVHSVTTYVSQEEVILEAAKMENWRPVNVSFWHKTQPSSGAPKVPTLVPPRGSWYKRVDDLPYWWLSFVDFQWNQCRCCRKCLNAEIILYMC